jgi:hypothetical protein
MLNEPIKIQIALFALRRRLNVLALLLDLHAGVQVPNISLTVETSTTSSEHSSFANLTRNSKSLIR